MGKPKNKKGKGTNVVATDANALELVSDLSLPLPEDGHGDGNAYNGESSNDTNNQLAPVGDFDPENHPLIQAATAMDASLCEAQRRFKSFRKTCQSETRDLLQLNTFKQQLAALKQLCKEKDAKINQQKSAILELDSIREGVRIKYEEMCADVQASQRELEDEREAFEEHILKEEKSMKAKRAEDELEVEKELAQLKGELQKEMDEKLHQSMQELKGQEEATERMRQEMGQAKAELEKQIEKRDTVIKTQKLKLKQEKEECEMQVRLMNSFKDENVVFRKKLSDLENEFAIGDYPPAHYIDEFDRIFTTIESISLEFFSKVETGIQKQMAVLDPCFNSVPFSNNEDSQRLIVAHVQRIISAALVSKVWQPYLCTNTHNYPELIPILQQVVEHLPDSIKGHNAKRKSRLWYVWTMKSLLKYDLDLSPLPRHKNEYEDVVVEGMLLCLEPMIKPDARSLLREKLQNLVLGAMELWNEVQTDQLDFEISLNLDPAKQSEWWTQDIDEDNDAGKNLSATTKTRPRIFPRFPRIIARQPDFNDNIEASKAKDIIIHPGLGLPEWSSLVLSGKEEAEERREREKVLMERIAAEMAIDMAKERSERASKRSRRGSVAHGPSSPTARWNEAKTMEVAE